MVAALIIPSTAKFTRARVNKRTRARMDISATGAVFMKELVKVGTYYDANNNKQTFTSKDLREWVRETNRYIDNGNFPAVPVEHTQNPEANRGKLLRVMYRKNSRGEDAIFGLVQFRDKDAEKLATSVDTSVFVESQYRDGKGSRYSNVITHVALTNYPVVSGLEGFEFVQLSLSKRKKKMASDTLTALAKKIGVRVMANDDDEKLSARIEKKFGTIKAALPSDDDEEEDDEEKDDEEDKPFTKKKKAAKKASLVEPQTIEPQTVKPPKAMLSLLKSNRAMQLEKLVDAGKITPAVRKEVEKQYCSDDKLSIACSLADGDGDDGFDFLIASFEKNDPVQLSKERTGSQTVRMSKGDVDEDAKRVAAARDADIAKRRAKAGLKD